MNAVIQHLTKCFIAGIVALLPVGGLVLTIVYMEYSIAQSWLAQQEFYFPGMGILAVAILVYLIGLAVSNFIGRWLWELVDSVLKKLPLIGSIYQTLKQVLGYGEGEGAFFQGAVLVPSRDLVGEELGLVTNRITDEKGVDKLVVFIPGAPNPSAGRMLIIEEERVRPLAMPVNQGMKALVSVGKTDMSLRLR